GKRSEGGLLVIHGRLVRGRIEHDDCVARARMERERDARRVPLLFTGSVVVRAGREQGSAGRVVDACGNISADRYLDPPRQRFDGHVFRDRNDIALDRVESGDVDAAFGQRAGGRLQVDVCAANDTVAVVALSTDAGKTIVLRGAGCELAADTT